MPVRVRVRFSNRITGCVRMLVVLIMHVRMGMLELLVVMPMLVPLT